MDEEWDAGWGEAGEMCMEAQDWDMVDGGMGEYAGVYGTAYDITYMTGNWQGRTMRIQSSKGRWKKVTPEVTHEEA